MQEFYIGYIGHIGYGYTNKMRKLWSSSSKSKLLIRLNDGETEEKFRGTKKG